MKSNVKWKMAEGAVFLFCFVLSFFSAVVLSMRNEKINDVKLCEEQKLTAVAAANWNVGLFQC